MAVPGIQTNQLGYATYNTGKTEAKGVKETAKEQEEKTQGLAVEEQAEENTDKFVKSPTANATSKGYAAQLMAAEEQRVNSFQQMLRSMVVKQGQASNLKMFGLDLFVTPEQSAQAAKSISEGGEYSVDAVATRILDFAKALSGGDDSKISVLREAVEKGFKAAGVDLGGKLPSICNDTYTEVMKRFDDWENKGSTKVED